MPASYGDQELLIPVKDVPNDTVRWVETHITPEQIWQASNHTWQGAAVFGRSYVPWYNSGMGVVRPGHLYWPCGASRWARGYYFVGKTELDSILAVTDGNIPQDLVLDDNRIAYEVTNQLSLPIPTPVTADSPRETLGPGTEIPGSITASMYLLSPLPISQPSTFSGNTLEPVYLITLVDKRFYWQYQTTGDIVVTEGTTTWEDLFQACATRLGETFQIDTIESTYLKPSRIFTVHYDQITKYLDALCTATQRKVVVDLDGTIHIMKSSVGLARAAANDALISDAPLDDRKDTKLHSGGRYQWASTSGDVHLEVLNTFLPDNLELAFPDLKDGIWRDTFTPYQTATGLDGVPTKYTLRATVPAVYVGGSLTNGADLQAYTDQFTGDWVNWREGWLAAGVSGIVPYTPDGLHDDMEWIYRWDYVYTKIHRKHYDLVWEISEIPTAITSRKLVQVIKSDTPSSTVNNYDRTTTLTLPDGSAVNEQATWLKWTPSVNIDCTGFAGGQAGLLMELTNYSTSKTITLLHHDSGSSAGNQIDLPYGTQRIIYPGTTVFFKHDGTYWVKLEIEAQKSFPYLEWDKAKGPMPIQPVKFDTPSGSQNNYDRSVTGPTGATVNANYIVWDPSADVSLTGLAGGEAGEIVEFSNISTTKKVTVPDQSGSSSTGNKFKTPCTQDYVVGCQSGFIAKHDGSFWNILDKKPDELVQRVKTDTIGSNTDDYDRGNATYLQITASAALNLTGVTGGVLGLMIEIWNASTDDTKTITLKNATGSSSSNQILTPCTSDYILGCQEGVTLKHDGSKWNVLARRTNLTRTTGTLPATSLPTAVTASISHTSSDTISTSSQAQLALSTTDWNDGMTVTSNKLKVITAGKYLVTVNAPVSYGSTPSAFNGITVFISINGNSSTNQPGQTLIFKDDVAANSSGDVSASSHFNLSVDDTIEARADNKDGTNSATVGPASLTAALVR